MNKLIRIPKENYVTPEYVTPEVAALTDEVFTLHGRIAKKAKAMLHLYAEAGFKLLAIKKQLKHGYWSKWLDYYFPGCKETARGYIRVAENWPRIRNRLKWAKKTGRYFGLVQALAWLRLESESRKRLNPIPSRWELEVKTAERALAQVFLSTIKEWDVVEVLFLARHSQVRGDVLKEWMTILQKEIAPLAVSVVQAEDEIDKRFLSNDYPDQDDENEIETAKNKILDALPNRKDLSPFQMAFVENLVRDPKPILAASSDATRYSSTPACDDEQPTPKTKKPKPDQIVGLVTCGDSKVEQAVPARDLYKGSGFKCAARWAKDNCTQWFILSAEHGLLPPDKVIEPYDTYLPKLSKVEQRAWAEKVRKQLAEIKLPLVYLGGKDYLEILNAGQSKLPIIDLFKAIGVSNRGKRASWLKQNPKLTNELREKLGLPLKPTTKVDKKTIAKPTKHKQTKRPLPTAKT